jgi:transcriptional regulator with XRE-family HTH domain
MVPDRLPRCAGKVLRGARERLGLTLEAVGLRSHGRFKPSALGGYERGERSISLERFVALAELYEVPADSLLGEVLRELYPESRAPVAIDLNVLASLGEHDDVGGEAQAVGELVHSIRSLRGDYLTSVVSLRSGDLDSVTHGLGLGADSLLEHLRGAVRVRENSEAPKA